MLFLLMDTMKAKTPVLRMSLGVLLVYEMSRQISRRGGEPLSHEQNPPIDVGFMIAWLGSNTQLFVKTLDTTTLALLAGGIVNTFRRPYECAFIMLDCSVPEVIFKGAQDRAARSVLGRRRRKLMGMYFSLFHRRTKVSLEKQSDQLDRHVQRLQQTVSETSLQIQERRAMTRERTRRASVRRAKAAAARVDPTDRHVDDARQDPDAAPQLAARESFV
mmetsp:Transcript_43255/g.119649  ORF Transcript_43255/g.119649 Transcript_43255/m.119649 type:complete len:218 (-) Transcript_43255:176-829(-)